MAGELNDGPQASVERVKQEVERWIDVARTAGERTLEAIGLTPLSRGTLPAVDLLETEEAIHLWIDVPGLSADQVQVSATETQVTVQVTRPTDPPGFTKYHLRERPQTSCQRVLALPASVNPDQTSAQLRDGVLQVTLPKQRFTSARSVPVNVQQ